MVYIGVSAICDFRYPFGVLKCLSPRKGAIIVCKIPLYHKYGYNAMNSQANC